MKLNRSLLQWLVALYQIGVGILGLLMELLWMRLSGIRSFGVVLSAACIVAGILLILRPRRGEWMTIVVQAFQVPIMKGYFAYVAWIGIGWTVCLLPEFDFQSSIGSHIQMGSPEWKQGAFGLNLFPAFLSLLLVPGMLARWREQRRVERS